MIETERPASTPTDDQSAGDCAACGHGNADVKMRRGGVWPMNRKRPYDLICGHETVEQAPIVDDVDLCVCGDGFHVSG